MSKQFQHPNRLISLTTEHTGCQNSQRQARSVNNNTNLIKTMRSITQCYRHVAMAGAIGLLSTVVMADPNKVNENDQRHLLIELTPAMCALYPVRANSIQCLNHYHVTVEGLDLGYRCLSSTTPNISPVQRRVLQRVMPDSLYVNQTWRRYGACSPYKAKNYFRQLSDMADELNIPARLKENHSIVISRSLFINDMQRANQDLGADSIQLTCETGHLSKPILTKMKICYDGDGFTQCPQATDSCQDNFIIWGSYE